MLSKIALITVIPILMTSGSTSVAKTSEVSITFTEPNNPEVIEQLNQAKESFENERVREIQHILVDAPNDYSHTTKLISNNKTIIFKTDRIKNNKGESS